MILSLLIFLIGGFSIGYLFEKINIPKIVGMIIFGILISPSILNLVSPSLINISDILRKIALVIIITRAGLNLSIKSIKEMGINALLISFIPATFEIIGVTIFSYLLLNISIVGGILLGTVLAAVSPAIVVPRMIKLKNKGYKEVSELVLVGSSIDDIYVIVLFYATLNVLKTNKFDIISIVQIPSSIILGILLGLVIGIVIYQLLKLLKFNNYINLIVLFSLSILLVFSEDILFIVVNFLILISILSIFIFIVFFILCILLVFIEYILFNLVNVSTLISILSLFIFINFKNKEISFKLEENYKHLWFFFEIILFVLVGVSVDIKYALSEGFMPVIVLLIGLTIRSLGTFIALTFTNFNFKEKLFIIFSYLPKATVQASIGGIALSEGLNVGPLILTLAVLSILITAPIGATLIDNTYKKLLNKNYNKENLNYEH